MAHLVRDGVYSFRYTFNRLFNHLLLFYPAGRCPAGITRITGGNMERKLSDIKKIIVHCSDSEFGDVHLIDRWHRARGWRGCGYHWVITNGVIDHGKPYNPDFDGLIQQGRLLTEIGAHCKGHNHDSIGICLIGRHHFTAKQLYEALPNVLRTYRDIGLTWEHVYGHCEFSATKTCPNIDPKLIRMAVM